MSHSSRTAVIKASDLKPQPWRNGAGINRVILLRDQTGDSLGWSLSIADLAGDAAFSDFPKADRIFTLIEGNRCTLSLDGRPLDCRLLVPASFPGDVPTHCSMHGTPGRAFNLVYDRERFRGQVMVRSLAAGHRIPSPPSTTAIHCLAGSLELDGATLLPGDTALPEGMASIQAGTATTIALFAELTTRD